MAARRKNQDEKNLKLLRELATQPSNKQCFDCRQKGPTYINMTIGSFVCTTCSGILRGLNPPHRVKSISMTSFTTEDIDFIKSRGNDFCRKVWFGQCDPKTNVGPESKDEQKLKDFMMQAYDKKRWWIDPSTVAARTTQIEQSVISPPDKVPLSTLLGKSHTPLYVPNNVQNKNQTGQANASVAMNQGVTTATTTSTSKSLDLLAEFGADPFGNASNTQTNSDSSGNFANFDNNPAFSNTGLNQVTSPMSEPFGAPAPNLDSGMAFSAQQPSNTPAPFTAQQPSQTPASFSGPPAAFQATSASFPPASNSMNLPSSGFPSTVMDTFVPPSQATASSTPATSTIATAPMNTQGGDRYAALADLDSMFSQPQTSQSSTWDNPTPPTTSATSSGWQTNSSNDTTAVSSSPPSNVGGDAGLSNPFGGAGGGAAPLWNQAQPPATNQMWGGQQVGVAPQQQQQHPQQPTWNRQGMVTQPTQAPTPAWSNTMPGQMPQWNPAGAQPNAAQTWNQQQQQPPLQSAFSTGNPFQMGQAPNASGAFPTQPNMMGGSGAFFSSQPVSSSTTTVPSDAGFANFNVPASTSGFAAFPTQSVTSPPNGQSSAAQFPVQNGGFGANTTDNWNGQQNSSWNTTPQAFQPTKAAVVNTPNAAAQFGSWQQQQQQPTSMPSNPFLAGGVSGNPAGQRVNSSNPFL